MVKTSGITARHPDTAIGISAEVSLAQEEKVQYLLLRGYTNRTWKKLKATLASDSMYKWTWDNLKKLVGK